MVGIGGKGLGLRLPATYQVGYACQQGAYTTNRTGCGRAEVSQAANPDPANREIPVAPGWLTAGHLARSGTDLSPGFEQCQEHWEDEESPVGETS